MEKIRHFVLDKPLLYWIGLGVSVSVFMGPNLSFSQFDQATAVLFWWYGICTATVGLYMVWCCLIMFVMSLQDRSTRDGWNWENRPSIQELKKTDPMQARVLATMWDQIDSTKWQGDFVRLVFVSTVVITFPLGAFYLRESLAEVVNWWKLALALVHLTYGFVMYSRCNR